MERKSAFALSIPRRYARRKMYAERNSIQPSTRGLYSLIMELCCEGTVVGVEIEQYAEEAST